ncbi:MAG: hypothetical protein JWQ25_397 [Daejeonella sp.]|nr:hypothetical protein [Daejeonella sp.]
MQNYQVFGRWENAWQVPDFRRKLFIAIAVLLCLLPVLPHFYQYIQLRSGYTQNDPVLSAIPPHDVSIPVFTVLWLTMILSILRAVQNPKTFLKFLYGFLILNITRLICIAIVPLNPPIGLIPMIDPISNFFYGKSYVTKDLFYSGHTAAQVLIFLCLNRKWDKKVAAIAAALIAILVLVQHVHYTLDVICAPFFGYLSYYLSVKILSISKKKGNTSVYSS